MWASLVTAFLGLLDKVLGIWRAKEEVKKKEFEVRNTEEQVRRAEIVVDVKEKDINEDLVAKIAVAKTLEEKEKLLNEIRRRTAA